MLWLYYASTLSVCLSRSASTVIRAAHELRSVAHSILLEASSRQLVALPCELQTSVRAADVRGGCSSSTPAYASLQPAVSLCARMCNALRAQLDDVQRLRTAGELLHQHELVPDAQLQRAVDPAVLQHQELMASQDHLLQFLSQHLAVVMDGLNKQRQRRLSQSRARGAWRAGQSDGGGAAQQARSSASSSCSTAQHSSSSGGGSGCSILGVAAGSRDGPEGPGGQRARVHARADACSLDGSARARDPHAPGGASAASGVKEGSDSEEAGEAVAVAALLTRTLALLDTAAAGLVRGEEALLQLVASVRQLAPSLTLVTRRVPAEQRLLDLGLLGQLEAEATAVLDGPFLGRPESGSSDMRRLACALRVAVERLGAWSGPVSAGAAAAAAFEAEVAGEVGEVAGKPSWAVGGAGRRLGGSGMDPRAALPLLLDVYSAAMAVVDVSWALLGGGGRVARSTLPRCARGLGGLCARQPTERLQPSCAVHS
jgi:hypothetical protein